MDLHTLDLFTAVMRQGSYAAVARDRDLAPSTVSRAITALERELGLRLFERSTRKLAPTEAALAYHARLQPLLDELTQAGGAVRDLHQQPQGTLRVTASVSFGRQLILPMLPELAEQYPALKLELLLSDATLNLLDERIDLAVRLGPLADSSLVAQRLMRTRYVVCASPDYLRRAGTPQTPTELTQHDCLRLPWRGFRERWRFRPWSAAALPAPGAASAAFADAVAADAPDADAATLDVPVDGRLVITPAEALRDCALAGLGIALLADWLVADDLRSGRLQAVLGDWAATGTDFDTAAWLVSPSRHWPLKVRVFADLLRQRIDRYREPAANY